MLDVTTIRFQTEIINRLKLFTFSKSAILHYSKSQKNEFKGYSFEKLQSQFKLVGFKEGSKVKSIKYKDIVHVGNDYIKGELTDSIFVLNMATFEHWLLRVLRALILSKPQEFYPKSKKQIDVTYLKKFADMPMLWEELVDDYLSTLPYQGMKPMLKTFLSCFGLKESDFTNNLLGMINENSLCRNVIMHNQKKVNATYIKKCGKFGKFAEGKNIVVTEDLLFCQADNLLRFMQDFRNNHT
jgi:hypothetical protein